MDQAVFQTLADTLSADPNARMAAELRLKELQSMPGILPPHLPTSPQHALVIRNRPTILTTPAPFPRADVSASIG